MYSLLPFWFLGGLLTLVALFGLLSLFWKSKRQWLRLKILRTSIIYTIVFWGVILTTTDIKRDYIFSARWRHTPGSEPGTSNLVTLDYVDYPNCYERVNSGQLYQHLLSKNSEFATVTIRVAYDFGSVRGYFLQRVDDLPANQSWAGGNTPWQIFGRRNFTSRWLKFFGTILARPSAKRDYRNVWSAAEFQKILDHSGIVWNCWTEALARLGLARANALQAKTSQGADADAARVRALAAYKDLLALWKDADPDIPILKQAKAEFAKLQ